METSYKSTALCLVDEHDSVVFWLPRGLKYNACRSMAELGLRALALFDIDVNYRAKTKSLIVPEETSKHRIYADITKGLVDNQNQVKILFKRGELFKRTMMMAEEMGLNLYNIQVEVIETLCALSLKDNGEYKFFEDFRKE